MAYRVKVDPESFPEMAAKALKTLPFSAWTFYVQMRLGRIEDPRHLDDEDNAKYIDECEEIGIIPYSTMKFGQFVGSDFLVPREMTFSVDAKQSPEASTAVSHIVKNGGSPEEVIFDVYQGGAQNIFNRFQKTELVDFLEEGYEVKSANAKVIIEGDVSMITIGKLWSPAHSGLELVLGGGGASKRFRQDVIKPWINNLKEKYGQG